MSARQELEELRRIDELERKAGGAQPTTAPALKAKPSLPKSRLELVPDFLQPVLGVGEAVANMASGMVAKPLSDLAGLGGVLAGVTGIRKNANPEAEKQAVAEALTYQPRTNAGRIATESNPIALAGKHIINPIAETIGDVAAMPFNDAGTKSVIKSGATEAALQGAGLLGVTKGFKASKPYQPTAHTTDIVKKTALDKGRALGLEAAPTEIGSGKFLRQAEGVAGSSEIKTDFALQNRLRTNAAVREQAGMAPETPLTPENYAAQRARHAQPYQQASGMGNMQLTAPPPAMVAAKATTTKTGGSTLTNTPPTTTTVHTMDAADAVTQISKLRRDSNMIKNSPIASTDVEQMAKARGMVKAADYLETQLENKAVSIGQADLVPKLRESRTKIAQLHNMENATIGGDVHANLLAKQKEKGSPLSGNINTIAEFQQHAPGSMKHPTQLETIPVDTRNMLISALRMVAKPIARKIVLSSVKPPIQTHKFRNAASASAVAEALRNKEQQDATQ